MKLTISKPVTYIAIFTGTAAVLLLLITLVLPMIVRSKAVDAIHESTGRTARIGSVSINPFSLTATVTDFAIEEKAGAPLFGFRQVSASLAPASIYKRALILSHVSIDTPTLSLARTAPSRYNFSDIVDKQQHDAKPKQGGSVLFSINNIIIKNGSVDFNDSIVGGGRRHTVRTLDVAIPFISNIPYLAEAYTAPKISAVVDGAPFSFGGKLKPLSKSLESSVRIDLKRLSLPQYVAYVPATLPADLTSGALTIDTDINYRISADKKPELSVKGTIRLDDIALNLKSGPAKSPALKLTASRLEVIAERFGFDTNGLTLDRGSLSLNGLATRAGAKNSFDLALLQVTGAAFRQKDNSLTIDDIHLSGGNASLSREADGTIPLLPFIATAESARAKGHSGDTKVKSSASDAKPLEYQLKQCGIDKFNIAFTDRTREDEARFTLRDTSLTLHNLNGPKFTPAALHFASTFGKNARLAADGAITPAPFRYQGSVKIGQLPIRDFEPYFPDSLNVSVISGLLDTTMNVAVTLANGKPGGTFKGSAGIRAFHCVDTIAEEDLLKWENLQFDLIQGTLEPFSLAIHEVALNNVYSRIVVSKDGTLNLQNLVTKETTTASQATPTAPMASAQPPGAPASPVAPPRRVSVGSVTIQDGLLSFTDHHLPQTFSTRFYKLGGRVSGLSSEETRFADVDLRGNLENHSPLQISGKINPLRNDLFADLKVSFQDIELTPVTPYSGTYLGYTVATGKLFLDLTYLIDKKQLKSDNKVFIDQFTFGRKVESDKATNLPVRLAVALLKDRKGEIHLNLPVTGRTDDPQFSVWGVVGQVLKNLLVKAATSPLALLSSMTGGEDFSSVQFVPGSSKLAAEEERKLQQLATALLDRPGLKIEIKAFVDKDKDPEGYRHELLKRKLRREKLLQLAKEQQVKVGESPEAVKIAAEEYSSLLTAVYKKEKFPKPRNAMGLVKELPDNEMEKLIIANTVIGDNELQTLARSRANSVMNFLVSKGGLPLERLFQKDEGIYKASDNDTSKRSRVEFSAIAQ